MTEKYSHTRTLNEHIINLQTNKGFKGFVDSIEKTLFTLKRQAEFSGEHALIINKDTGEWFNEISFFTVNPHWNDDEDQPNIHLKVKYSYALTLKGIESGKQFREIRARSSVDELLKQLAKAKKELKSAQTALLEDTK